MTARKKTTKAKSTKTGARKRTRRPGDRARQALDEGLGRIEKQVPANMRPMVKDVRKNLRGIQKQIDRARADREARWDRLENQVRRDVAAMLRRLEKAVAPRPTAKARKKAAAAKPKARAGTKRARKKAAAKS